MKPIFISWWHIITICLMASCTVTVPERLGSDMTISNGKKDGWSASGELQLGNVNKEVSLQANFDEPGTYTLQFSVDYPSPPAAAFFDWDMTAEADIFWSVEGNTVRRRVSVTPGASISGTGQGVKVKLVDASLDNLGGISVRSNYPVTIQIAPGIRGGDEPPFLQRAGEYSDGLVAVNQIVADVPKDAGVKSFRVYAAVEDVGGIILPAPDAFYIKFQVNNSLGATSYVSIINPQDQGFITLPKGAIAYELRCNTAFAPVGGVTSDLAIMWGIDG